MRNFTRTASPSSKAPTGFTGTKAEQLSKDVWKKLDKEQPGAEELQRELPEFHAGDFVRFIPPIEPSRQTGVFKKNELRFEPLVPWGCNAGVVIAQSPSRDWTVVLVNSCQNEFEKRSLLRADMLKSVETVVFGKPKQMVKRLSCLSTVFLAKHDVVPNSFPILRLPLPALAAVLHSLGTVEAAWASVTCKRFLLAFRHELIWKEKTLLAMERAVLVSPGADWFTIFRDKACWTITVVSIFSHRGGTSISGTFSIAVSPKCTVERLLELLNRSRKNAHASFSVADYKPHDPSLLGKRENGGEMKLDNPNGKPNCQFEVEGKDLSILTIAEAGLGDGAVLEVRERLLCD